MAKAKKKSAKEASETFHNIMAASVKGNPKPKMKDIDIDKSMNILNHLKEEVAMIAPDWGDYVILQISPRQNNRIYYNIDSGCPIDKSKKIEKVILENAALLNLAVTTDDIE